MAASSIEWTDATWNPVRGCDAVSPGCANCYAAAVAARFSGPGQPYEGTATRKPGQPAKWTGKIILAHDKLTDPLKWRKPKRVFVNSMSDLFHKDVPDEFIDRVFAVMGQAGQHTFQILTKRPERMCEYMNRLAKNIAPLETAARAMGRTFKFQSLEGKEFSLLPWPIPNVWLGTSTENQAAADERIPHLLDTPAAVRFLSCEPLLGPVDLTACRYKSTTHRGSTSSALNGTLAGGTKLHLIDWVIVGGESGKGSRPFDLAWARSLRDQCKAAGVAYFFKQAGSRAFDSDAGRDVPGALTKYTPEQAGNATPEMLDTLGECLDAMTLTLRDKKGGDLNELPSDLRIREFPTVPK